jgi:hypothetical protein
MIANRKTKRGKIFSAVLAQVFAPSALAMAMAVGVVATAAPAMAAGPAYSKPFVAVAGPLQADIEKYKKTPDAALLAALKTKIDAAIAAATAPDDKNAAGNFAVNVGTFAQDTALQRKGINLMIESGKQPAEALPRLHFFLGNFAAEAKEFDVAKAELEKAMAGGVKDADVYVLMAQVYIGNKQEKEGLPYLVKAIDSITATGKAAPDSWYRSALSIAYGQRDYVTAQPLSMQLVKAYPSQKNWSLAIVVLRDLGRLPAQDSLDLLRLMSRTKSFAEERDYAEFVQAADARRNPPEVKAAIDAGVAAGLVNGQKQFFSEALKIAESRIAADKASLPALDKDARAANATAARVNGAADAFLSYGQGATAAELYKLALEKPGVDKPVVLTRLGIAQIDAGDYAGAQASFAKVEGPRLGLAQLWSVYAAQKAAGK